MPDPHHALPDGIVLPGSTDLLDERCVLCGDPLGKDTVVDDDGATRFCCSGCQMVWRTLRDPQLLEFTEAELGVLDDPQLASRLVSDEGGSPTVRLAVDGIRCASCAWLIESALLKDDAVKDATVSLTEETVKIRLRSGDEPPPLGRLARRLQLLGYKARPTRDSGDLSPEAIQARRDEWLRLGVAAACALNLMLFAVGMYAAGDGGMERSLEAMFRWLSLLVATPILLYSSAPIMQRAVESARQHVIHVDVPVALAIVVMYGSSSLAVVQGTGHIWFDSLGMLVTLLLGGRAVEGMVRRRTSRRLASLLGISNARGRRVAEDGSDEWVPAELLEPEDRIRLSPGDRCPADVEVTSGRSDVDLSVVDGESRPRLVGPGDELPEGSVLLTGAVEAAVVVDPGHSTLARMRAAVDDAMDRRGKTQALADRISRTFIAAVLLIAATTAALWWHIDPTRAMPITISVLVVACPCALALATPLAFAAALHGAATRGLLVRSGEALLALARVDRVVFDKTGTLTEARPLPQELALTEWGEELSGDEVLRLTGSACSASRHPVSQAVLHAARERTAHPLDLPAGFRELPGQGLVARVGRRAVQVGRPGATITIDQQVAGRLALEEPLRAGARETIDALRRLGVLPELLSGDEAGRASDLAARLGIDEVRGELTPAQKGQRIRALKQDGHRVVFVGDGLNDAPSLAEADVGLAVAEAVDLSLEAADGVLHGGPGPVIDALGIGRQLRRILIANLTMSLVYNTVAVSAAVAGWISPLAAAVLMPFSSIVVITNAVWLAGHAKEYTA